MYLDDYVKASLANDDAGKDPPTSTDAIEEMKAELAVELNKIHADMENRFKELEKRFDSEPKEPANNDDVDVKKEDVDANINDNNKGEQNNE